MNITPIIAGNVARSAHPKGCAKMVDMQIAYVEQQIDGFSGPKKALILGASSGYGLAARIALAFGDSKADTIGVSFERSPDETFSGTAGWYNNIQFRQRAEEQGRIAKNFIGDAFSPQLRQQVMDFIKNEFGGQIDILIYSLATGIRIDSQTGQKYRSSLKPCGQPFSGSMINIEQGKLEQITLEPATEQECEDTIKVMGGEDWSNWLDELAAEGLLANGFKTIAFSYIGPEHTWPIYHAGTLGKAKQHLHDTALILDKRLKLIDGYAGVAVCKALVTKASVFIPAFSPYISVLTKVLKQQGLDENCIEQIYRLLSSRLYREDKQIITDQNALLRLDDYEMRPEIQQKVISELLKFNADNFKEIGDYQQYLADFMSLNGFEVSGVDYTEQFDLAALQSMQP